MKIDIIRFIFRHYLRNKKMLSDDIDMEKVKNILFMSNTAIGDTLFATPALRLIKRYYPQKKVIVLLNPTNYKLFETNPFIDNFLTFNGKWSGFFQVLLKLRKLDVDVTLIMNCNEPQATPLAYLLGSKYIIRVPNINNEFNFLHYNEPIAKTFKKNTIYTRLKQLEYIGITDESYQMELFPTSDWYAPVKNILDDGCKYIGIQVGASHISRMWFDFNWVLLVRKILKHNKNIKIVLTGSKLEVGLTSSIEGKINDKRVLNLAGKFDICSAAALLGSLDLLITPDTGPLHIAAALKTPTVAISVAGIESSSKPIDSLVKHVFIQKPKTCDPCLDKQCKYQKCMLQITPDEVFDKFVSIFSGKKYDANNNSL